MKKILLITLIFLLSFGMIFPVSHADVGDITILDFDDVSSGLSNGTSGKFDFQWSSGLTNNFKTSTDNDLSPSNSFYFTSYNKNDGADGTRGYFNATEDLGYCGVINFSFVYSRSDTASVFIDFYNDSNKVISIWFGRDSSATDSIQWYDVSNGYHILYDCAETRYYLKITHNGTNQFNIKLYDDALEQVANADYAGAYASDFFTFDQIRTQSVSGEYLASNKNINVYIDDLIINANEQTNLPEVTGTAVFMNGQSGLHDTDLNVNNYFNVHLTGDAGRKAKVFIKDPSDTTVYYTVWTYPLIPLPIYDYSLYFSKIFTTVGTYTFTITDFYNSANTWSSTFDVVLGGNDYEGTYGNTSAWAEFIRTGADCEYKVGDYFDIVCYLPYDATNNTDSDYYKLFFFALGTNQNGTMEDYNAGGYRGSTVVHYANNLQFLNDVCEINNFGQWRIEVWSCESDNTAKEELNASSMIYVCNVNVSTQNSYEILLDPNYAEYNRNGTMTVTIRKTGDKLGSYFIKSPYASYIEIKTLYNETETITLDFSTYNDSHLGTWYIKAYDFSGSPSDWNAKSKEFKLVSTPDAVEPTTPIFPSLSAPLGAIIGMIIVVACIILPLLIGGQFQTEVPVFAYALSGGVGIVVSTIFGFFPSWVIFFLVAIGLIAVFFMWLIGKQNGGT